MMADIAWDGMAWTSAAVLLAGLFSAVIYGRRRKWSDAGLALLAALALAGMLAGLSLPAGDAGELAIATANGASTALERPEDDQLVRALLAAPQASAISLSGPGLREAQWQDLPARPLRWTEQKSDLLNLDFPRTLALGRTFTLTAQRAQPQPGWRLQLLAENGQVLAESSKAAADASRLSVQWLPPLAEDMVLQARLLDAAGKSIAQGPVPLRVSEPLPLQVQGRFGAASFDARVLSQLLADSGAILDWQVTLGKGLSRSETARAPLTERNAQFIDAAYFEGLSPAARSALLAQTGQGLPLIILAGNAADSALWQRELGLRLTPQSPATEKEAVRQFAIGAETLALPPAGLNPAGQAAGGWAVLASDSRQQPWLWQRPWKQGRIVWVGVTDWHRYAISSPAALALWWQTLLDTTAVGSTQKIGWRQTDLMPVVGLRSEICAQGLAAGSALRIDGQPDSAWQARASKADGVCAAFWPQRAGWQTLRSGDAVHRVYVYAPADWPAWQKALRHDATLQYAARLPQAASASAGRVPLAAWPFALVFGLCMLALWWRERR
jgi:hypothetical protein